MSDIVLYRYNNAGEAKGPLPYTEAAHEESLDGTDVLTIVTEKRPHKRARIVWQDGNGVWREHMVDSQERTHAQGKPRVRSTCVNSIAELYGVQASGTKVKSTVGGILRALLKDTRWTAGRCDDFGGRKMELEVWHKDVRACVAELVDLCGGEMVTAIEVSGGKVTKRTVRIVEERGRETVKRQFRWGRNMGGVRRTVASDEVYTAIVGYGKKVLEIELEAELDELQAEDDAIDAEQDAIDAAAKAGASSESLKPRRDALKARKDAQTKRRQALNERLRKVRDDDYAERITVKVRSSASLASWGTPQPDGTMGHTWVVYTDDACTDKDFLKRQCEKQLAKLSKPQIQYEFDAYDIGGERWGGVKLGDRVHVVDDDIDLDSIERVSSVRRSLLEGGPCHVMIGERPNVIVEKFVAVEKQAKKTTGNSARVAASAPVTTNGTYSGGSRVSVGASIGGDGWTHQVNGVTQAYGTINFVTDGSSA